MSRVVMRAFGSVGMPLTVFAVALLCVLPGIGRQEIWTRDETRTALVVQEILRSGDWMLPRVAGGLHSAKPPLYHWLTALGARPRLDETTLRIPAAIAAAAAVTVTYLFGAQLASPAIGLVAATILVATPGFFEWARTGRMDTLLVFCIALSLLGLARWLQFGGRYSAIVFGVGMGLGVLTKGPPGLLPLAVAALALMVSRPAIRRVHELTLGLACVIVLPLVWLGPAALTAVDFDRYVEGLAPRMAKEIARPSRPGIDGVVALALGFFPWTLLLPGAIVILARRRPIASPFLVVVLAWALVVVAVFLGVISSRPVYFLPAYPALALIVAWCWQHAEGRERRWLMAPLGVGIAAVATAGLVNAVWAPTLWFHDASLSIPPRVGLTISAVLLVVGSMALGWWRQGWWPVRAIALGGGVAATLLALDLEVRVPFYNRLYPVRSLVTRLERQIPAGAEVAFIDDQRLTALAVHLSRPMRQVASPAHGSVQPVPPSDYLLLTDDLFAEFAPRWSLDRLDEVPLRNARYVLARRR